MMGSWKKIKIGEFLFEREGKYKPNSKEIAGLKRIDKIDFSGNFHIAQKPSNTDMILIRCGDLVISGINVAKGAMGIYHGYEDITATIHYSSYTFDKSKIEVGYLKRFLKSAEFIRLLQEQVKGGIKTEIKPKHILPLEIELPDIEKQKKIAKHLINVENEEKKLKTEITHQKTLLKKLRQQILQEAIEGKLTADWRTDNPNIEPASELLKRIQKEKDQLIKDSKIKKQKPLPPISEEEKPFVLPEGWEWCRLGDITQIKGGKRVSNGYKLLKTKTPYVYIRVSDMSNQTILDDNLHYIDSNMRKIIERYVITKDDLYIVIVGATIGKCGLVPPKFDGMNLTENAARIIIHCINKKYLLWLMNSRYCQRQFINKTKRVGVQKMALNRLVTSVLPLPPLAEQKAIVSKVEKLLAICDQLETQITQNQTHADQLMQAVLKEAFTHEESTPSLLSVRTPLLDKEGWQAKPDGVVQG